MRHHQFIVTWLAAAAIFSITCKNVSAVTVRFDDAYADLGESSDPATYYQADLGVTFSGQYFGVVGGQGNGDTGNWELRGTNGSALLGINTSTSGSPTINFGKVVTGFSVDVGVPEFGSTANSQLRATGFRNGQVVEIRSVFITTTGDVDGEWEKLTFTQFVDSVRIQKISGTANAYGVDNYRFSIAEVVWAGASGGSFFSSVNWEDSAAPPSNAKSITVQPQFGGTVSGLFSTVVTEDFTLGAGIGTGTLEIGPTGVLIASNTTNIQASGRITGAGSFISQESVFTLAGTLDLADSLQVIAQTDLVNNGRIEGNGDLDVGNDMANNGSIQLGGKLKIANGAFNNATLELVNGGVFEAGLSLTNNAAGVITGDGQLAATVSNVGTMRVAAGNKLTVDNPAGATSVSNSNTLANPAQIELLGGTIEVKGDLVNGDFSGIAAPGRIVGHGTLIVEGTLTNKVGTLAFSGDTDILGDVDNQDTIIVTGNSRLTFFDDVDHTGTEIRVSDGSIAVFFGDVTGAGPYTGSGTVQLEGTFSPGNSPGLVNFGGDLELGDRSTLVMELGGLLRGDEYDAIGVDGMLPLNGILDIQLIDGFAPSLGDTFDLFDSTAMTGDFDSILLPSLGSGLSFDLSSLATNGTLVVVPEPSTVVMLGLAGLWVMVSRRESRG